jgi:hypothetical protein
MGAPYAASSSHSDHLTLVDVVEASSGASPRGLLLVKATLLGMTRLSTHHAASRR